jgi:hypothetical protein
MKHRLEKMKAMQTKLEDGNAVLTSGWPGAGVNPFGPQSPWSALLAQREHLDHEIKRAKECLERIRTDPSRYAIRLQVWPADKQEPGNGWMAGPARKVSANGVMEQYLLSWLERLEERLGEVRKAIADIDNPGALQPLNPEPSMYALLRAAG